MRRSISISVKPRPQRICVTCHQVKVKRELIRLVRLSDGKVEIDISGKIDGRGAYLCRDRECWEVAFKSGRLAHSLKASFDRQQQEQILKAAEKLLSTSQSVLSKE